MVNRRLVVPRLLGGSVKSIESSAPRVSAGHRGVHQVDSASTRVNRESREVRLHLPPPRRWHRGLGGGQTPPWPLGTETNLRIAAWRAWRALPRVRRSYDEVVGWTPPVRCRRFSEIKSYFTGSGKWCGRRAQASNMRPCGQVSPRPPPRW